MKELFITELLPRIIKSLLGLAHINTWAGDETVRLVTAATSGYVAENHDKYPARIRTMRRLVLFSAAVSMGLIPALVGAKVAKAQSIFDTILLLGIGIQLFCGITLAITAFVLAFPPPLQNATLAIRNFYLGHFLAFVTVALILTTDSLLQLNFAEDKTIVLSVILGVVIVIILKLAQATKHTYITFLSVAAVDTVLLFVIVISHTRPTWTNWILLRTGSEKSSYFKVNKATVFYSRKVVNGKVSMKGDGPRLVQNQTCTWNGRAENAAGPRYLWLYCPPVNIDPALSQEAELGTEYSGWVLFSSVSETTAPDPDAAATANLTGTGGQTLAPVINPTPCNPVYLHGGEEVHIPACHSGWVPLEGVKQLTLLSSITPPVAWRGQRGSHHAGLPVGKLLVDVDGQDMVVLEGTMQTGGQTVRLMVNSPTGQEPAGGREMFKVAVGR